MGVITLLNLSDLHIQDGSDEQKSLLKDFSSNLRDFINQEVEWTPDFLVLPGDIVDRPKPASFSQASRFIDELLDVCALKNQRQRVIAAPGNHDKNRDSIDRLNKYKSLLANFEKFSQRSDDGKLLKQFKIKHQPCFEDFNSFYSQYSDSGKLSAYPANELAGYSYIPYHYFEEGELTYITGIKVFDDEKICFLCLNTEWLHAKEEIMNKVYKEDALPKAGSHIVSYFNQQIQKLYPEYTVVTLMHQGPEELCWSERNRLDLFQKHTLGNLYQCSDLIISGHTHSVDTVDPDMLRNLVQHIKLGASGEMKPVDGSDFPHSISLVTLNTSGEEMKVLKIRHDKTWIFDTEGVCVYPLRKKYRAVSLPGNNKVKKSPFRTCIRVKNYTFEEIKRRISKHYLYDLEDPLCPLPEIHSLEGFEEDSAKNELRRKMALEQKNFHLVLYMKDHDMPEEEYFVACETYRKIIKEFQNECLTLRLVIDFVIVQMPLKYKND